MCNFHTSTVITFFYLKWKSKFPNWSHKTHFVRYIVEVRFRDGTMRIVIPKALQAGANRTCKYVYSPVFVDTMKNSLKIKGNDIILNTFLMQPCIRPIFGYISSQIVWQFPLFCYASSQKRFPLYPYHYQMGNSNITSGHSAIR